MHRLTKGFATALLLVVLVVGSTGSAWAGFWFYNMETTEPSTSTTISGNYYVTSLFGYSATGKSYFLRSRAGDFIASTVWLNNTHAYGPVVPVYANLTNARFVDSYNSLWDSGTSQVAVATLTADWTTDAGLKIPKGSLIMGYQADIFTSPRDYNDFVLALSDTAPTTAPTPLPGAVWLLGSGLLGLMGFKRARKNA